MRWVLAGLLAIVLAGLGSLWLASRLRSGPQAVPTALQVGELLGDPQDAQGYARADRPRKFDFPADHGPHPEFRTEWWYLTGNLTGEDRPFGYQLTFFRRALTPNRPTSPSHWATRDLYMAHLTISDIQGNRFLALERFARDGLALAGARSQPFSVWLEDWTLGQDGEAFRATALTASQGVDLTLESERPPVLQGEAGLSRKAAGAGQASYYYSLPRLQTNGQLRLDGRDIPVAGLSWMDREWSSQPLDRNLVGWDWFSLHLDDGCDLMFYQLRQSDGQASPFSAGSLVEANGRLHHLNADNCRVEVLGYWDSPRGGARYPARWRLHLSDPKRELTVVPQLADQELNLTIRYWEGAVAVSGDSAGRGYVELVGYDRQK